MRATWLDAPEGARRSVSHLGDVALDFASEPDLRCAIDGYEVIVTATTKLPASILARCPWVRGVVGVGPEAVDLADWDQLRRRSVLVGFVPEACHTEAARAGVLAELFRIQRQLQALDAISEGWEGT